MTRCKALGYHSPIVMEPLRDLAELARRIDRLAAPFALSAALACVSWQASGQDAPSPSAVPSEAAPITEAIPQAPDSPILEIHEVKEAPPFARPIDLTAVPDDLWERIRTGFAMPDLDSPLVLDRQIWYASRPQLLRIIVERSKRYLYHIVEELEKRAMPTEIALLPMVESAFNPMAYSRAQASGLWQFIPSTGKRYELRQNWWFDARRDILASTSAALEYLQFLYEMHGDWHLALASYNWGENAVARAIERNRAKGLPTDYLSLGMPSETRYYVPKLQALKNIISQPGFFGLDLDPIPNQPYFVTVVKTADIDIKLAARLAEMTVEELIALNPAHNRPVLSATQSQRLVLPADRAEVFLANLENHDQPLTLWRKYTLKKGDKLEKLAAEHGIALAKLKQANGITPRTKLAPGFQLLLPEKGSSAALEPLPAGWQPPPTEYQRGLRTVTRRTVHTVQRGETLASIAARYKVGMDDLRRWNRIGRLFAGQKLNIEREVTVSTWTRKAATVKRPPVKRQAKRTRG